MERTTLYEKLKTFGIFTEQEYRNEAFSRNIGLFTEDEQRKLGNAKVAIPGMGGVGGIHLITMVRTGVSNFHISDFDVYEAANVNRQFGARIPDFGRPKLEVMKEQALTINPYTRFKEFPSGISEENVDAFLEGVDVVIDSLDFFAFDVRRLLFTRAREKGVHVITAGPLGYSSAMLIFAPDQGMGFDEYFNIVDDMEPEEQYLAFALGLAPKAIQFKYMDMSKVSFKAGKGPSLNIACQLCSSMAGTEAVRIILGKKGVKGVPYYFQFDPFTQQYICKKLYMGNRHPFQKIKAMVVKRMLNKNKTGNKADGINFPQLPSQPWENRTAEIPLEVVNYLVAAGTWAPSADNIQPWIVQWENQTLYVYKDLEKNGFFYDINGESTLMTLGAFTENMSIAASHFGLRANCEMFPKGIDSELVVQITFEDVSIDEDLLHASLFSRCVNRNPFEKQPIEGETKNQLLSILQDDPNVNIAWIDSPDAKKRMQKIVYDADRILFEEKRLHQGLFKWINLVENERNEGMDLINLEISSLQKLMFPFLADWSKLSKLNRLGASRMAAINSVALLKSSPAYCLLTLNEKNPEAYVNGGRAMERFWIKAASLNLSIQPMAGFVFLLNHLEHDGASQFCSAHQKMIRSMKEQLDSDMDPAILGKNILMFFRIGFCIKNTPRTNRRSIDL